MLGCRRPALELATRASITAALVCAATVTPSFAEAGLLVDLSASAAASILDHNKPASPVV